MANIKSAKKRVLVNKREKAENRLVKTSLSTEIKKFRKLVAEGNLNDAEVALKFVEADIMKAATKGAIHSNAASRKVSRLKALLSKAKGEGTKKAQEPKKAEVKEEVVEEKVEPKKAPAKKATTKKVAKEEKTEEVKTTKTTAKKAATKTAEKKETKTAIKAAKEPAKKETKTTAKKTKKAE